MATSGEGGGSLLLVNAVNIQTDGEEGKVLFGVSGQTGSDRKQTGEDDGV